jgi:methyl-accepting chemotaxis protein/methyl-accepting chemotaxis protein-1 (serine sensor receptor)
MDQVVNENAARKYLANQMELHLSEMISLARVMQLKGILKDQASVDKFHEDYRAELSKLDANAAQFSTLAKAPEAQEFLQAITSSSTQLAGFNDQIYQKTSSQDIQGAFVILRDQFTPFAAQLQARSEVIANMESEQMAQEVKTVKAIQAQAIALTIVMLLICAGVGVVVVLIVFGINRNLLATATSLSDGAAQIAAAAGQVSSSSQSLAQGATEQAAAIEETSASTEEINSMARRSTDSSRATAALVAESLQRVEMANQNLEDMVGAMNDLTDSSSKISKIIRVIDEIAFQTNILALNAAVEAARAGEAGMGFAVVAEEVRNLAQRSAQAAKDTASLIEDSIAKTSSSKNKVDQVAVTMRAITEESGRIKILVDGVSQGSEEQSRGIEQIGKAITQIEKVTQNAAANSEESAAAAEELSAQSETLREIISQLRRMVTSDDNSPAAAIRPRAQTPRRSVPSQFRPSPSVPAVASVKATFAGKGSLDLHRRDNATRAVKREALEEEFQDF